VTNSSSSSPTTGKAIRASRWVREPSCTRGRVGRTGRIGRRAGFGAVGPLGGATGIAVSKLPKHRTSRPSCWRSARTFAALVVPCQRCPTGSQRRPSPLRNARFAYVVDVCLQTPPPPPPKA
jgi:hypothetical protein